MHGTRRFGAAVLLALFAGCAGCAAAGPARSAAPAVSPAVRSHTTLAPDPVALSGSGSAGPRPAAGSGGRSVSPKASPAVARPLAGKIVGIDPGHNGRNAGDPGFIDQQIWNGAEYENCDTTGTETAGGYTEARFNFSLASYLRADLIAAGARVVLTRHTDSGVGPCVTSRAEIINRAHAN